MLRKNDWILLSVIFCLALAIAMVAGASFERFEHQSQGDTPTKYVVYAVEPTHKIYIHMEVHKSNGTVLKRKEKIEDLTRAEYDVVVSRLSEQNDDVYLHLFFLSRKNMYDGIGKSYVLMGRDFFNLNEVEEE